MDCTSLSPRITINSRTALYRHLTYHVPHWHCCLAYRTVLYCHYLYRLHRTALIWIRLFNWGGTELGIFLTVAGIVQTVVQLGLVKKICDVIGNERTLMLGAALAAIGITSFSFVSNPYLHVAIHLLFIGVGQGVQTPVLPSILSGYVPTAKRGLATGLQASFNSLGLCTAPFIAGALFDTNVGFLWGTFEFGSYSHFGFLFAGLANVLAIVIVFFAIGVDGDKKKTEEQKVLEKEQELAEL